MYNKNNITLKTGTEDPGRWEKIPFSCISSINIAKNDYIGQSDL
jgi:hypothetical protein